MIPSSSIIEIVDNGDLYTIHVSDRGAVTSAQLFISMNMRQKFTVEPSTLPRSVKVALGQKLHALRNQPTPPCPDQTSTST